MSRRYVLTVGSPECPRLGLPPLRRVAEDVERVASFFTTPEQGCERALTAELPLGASSGQIRESLSAWFADADRRETDCVVLYVAGHGDAGTRFLDHCLLTSDSNPRRSDLALRTAEL